MKLYKYELLLTLQTHFEAMKTPLGSKRTISIQLGAGRYKQYQSRSLTPVWGFVWPCKGCLSVWSHNLVGHNEDVVSAWGVFVTSHIGQGRKFLTLYMQRLILTKQTCFKAVRAPLGPKRTISTWLGVGRYMMNLFQF